MTSVFIMQRSGIFNPKKHTSNQCKESGHNHYEYICKIAFAPNTKLDVNDFLIDHIDVNKTIMDCALKGSCEKMHLTIMQALMDELTLRDIKVMGIKLTIIPKYPGGLAELSYISINPRYKSNLTCLLD